MKLSTVLSPLLLGYTLILTGCGSDDSSSSSLSSNSAELEKASEATYDCERTYSGWTTKVSADGKFEPECSEYGAGFRLADNTNELVVTQVINEEVLTYTNSQSSISATITTNFASGTVKFVGSDSVKGSFNCTNTYDIGNMPKTIYSGNEIWNLSWIDSDSYQMTDTTCPDWINEDSENDENGIYNGISTTTVTDSEGGTSTLKIFQFDEVDVDNSTSDADSPTTISNNLNEYESIHIYKNISSFSSNTLEEMYSSYSGFGSISVNSSASCSDYGFTTYATSSVVDDVSVFLYYNSDYSRMCGEYDYSNSTYSSGTSNVVMYYND